MAQPAKAKEPAEAPSSPDPEKEAARVERVPAERVAALKLALRGRAFVSGDRKLGLSRGMVVQVVAAPVENGKARLLGQAKVLQVRPRRVVVRPDDDVLAAKDAEWLVVLPEAPATASRAEPSDSGPARSTAEAPAPAPEVPTPTAPAPEPDAPPAPRELQGRISVKSTDLFNKALSLTNSDDIVWSGCTVVIRGRDFVKVGGLAPGTTRDIPLRSFEQGWRGRYVDRNRAGLFCEEGEREFPLKL